MKTYIEQIIERYEAYIKECEDFNVELVKDKPLKWESQLAYRLGMIEATRVSISDLKFLLKEL